MSTPALSHPAMSDETGETRAGRVLDALVAERVMGWRRVRGSFAGTKRWHADAVHLIAPGGSWPVDETSEPVTYIGPTVPALSTEPAAAWALIEAVRERWAREYADAPKQMCPFWTFVDCGEAGWRVDVTLGCDDGDSPVVTASAPTFPLAVCRAALALATGEVDEPAALSTPTGPTR